MKSMDKTWDALETLLAGRRRTIVDMLTMSSIQDEQSGTTTDVYKLLSDLYMQTCSVKVWLSFFTFRSGTDLISLLILFSSVQFT